MMKESERDWMREKRKADKPDRRKAKGKAFGSEKRKGAKSDGKKAKAKDPKRLPQG